MSRIHEALRKAVQENSEVSKPRVSKVETLSGLFEDAPPSGTAVEEPVEFNDLDLDGFGQLIRSAREISFDPPADALLVHPAKPREAPSEEFRTLRTRLNHLQTAQSLRTLVITSASPAEGKSFTAANLAITQAQLAGKRVLLADFDFRRPNIHKAFHIECSPGITDYLAGQVGLGDILQKVAGLNLYLMTAGDAVPNPLELLNLRECKNLIDQVRDHFDWVILDSPPLLFAADANLLASMCDGTILVVRIGTTTFDSVSRAVPSLSENNVLGVVVNGARRGELYNKYAYEYGYNSDKEPEVATPSSEGTFWV
ncbi:MAG: tyrosine-protein kinase family protein [Bryobacteraceae bacterium]